MAVKNKTVVGLYIRVSTQEQAKDGYSIDEQRERLTKYADAQGWVVYRVYSDPGFSGGSLRRPAMEDLVHDAQAGLVEKVVVYKLDRLSRSQKDTLYLIEDVFLQHGVDFVSMTENFDTGTPLGRAMIGILSVFAQLEREQIKERMSMGREGRAKSGLFHGSTKVPIGYRYKDGVLVVDPYEARLVRRCFREFVEGRSVYRITADLRAEGAASSYGPFTRNTVQYLLHNETYTGVIKHNGQSFEGRHEALVDREIYDRAQLRFQKAREAGLGYNFTHKTTLVAGLCYCGVCGRKMRTVYAPPRKRDGVRLRYIACPDKMRTGCTNSPTRQEAVEGYVLNEIRQIWSNPDSISEIKKSARSADPSEEIAILEARLAENKKKVARYMDLYALEQIDFSAVRGKIEGLTKEADSLRRQVAALRDVPAGMSAEDVEALSRSLEAYLDDGDQEKIRAVVSALVEKIVIGPEAVQVFWSF